MKQLKVWCFLCWALIVVGVLAGLYVVEVAHKNLIVKNGYVTIGHALSVRRESIRAARNFAFTHRLSSQHNVWLSQDIRDVGKNARAYLVRKITDTGCQVASNYPGPVNDKDGHVLCTENMNEVFRYRKTQGEYLDIAGEPVYSMSRLVRITDAVTGIWANYAIVVEVPVQSVLEQHNTFRRLLEFMALGFVVVFSAISGIGYTFFARSIKLQNGVKDLNERLRMIGSVSRHDVLNHLSVIQTCGQYMAEVGYDEDVAKDQMAETDAAVSLLQALSSWSKIIEIDGAELERADESLNDIVEAVMPNGVVAKVSELGTVSCNVGMMQAAVRNLLENSQKYCEGTSRIRIGRDGDRLYFVDNAGGFGCVEGVYSEKYADRLMRPSVRGEHDVAGSGLGLANIKAVLDAHGFGFSHETDCGVGTTWWIDLKDGG